MSECPDCLGGGVYREATCPTCRGTGEWAPLAVEGEYSPEVQAHIAAWFAAQPKEIDPSGSWAGRPRTAHFEWDGRTLTFLRWGA